MISSEFGVRLITEDVDTMRHQNQEDNNDEQLQAVAKKW